MLMCQKKWAYLTAFALQFRVFTLIVFPQMLQNFAQKLGIDSLPFPDMNVKKKMMKYALGPVTDLGDCELVLCENSFLVILLQPKTQLS